MSSFRYTPIQNNMQHYHYLVYLTVLSILSSLGSADRVEIYINNFYEYCTCSADFECIYVLAAFSGACDCKIYSDLDEVIRNMESDRYNSLNICCQPSVTLLHEDLKGIFDEKSVKSVRNERCLAGENGGNGKLMVRDLGKLSVKQDMAEFVWTSSLPGDWEEGNPVFLNLEVFSGVDEISAFTLHLTKQTFIYVTG